MHVISCLIINYKFLLVSIKLNPFISVGKKNLIGFNITYDNSRAKQ